MDNLSMNDSFRYLRTRRDGCLNIVAIGKTGEGKSATINTMISYSNDPKPNFFKEEESPFSVTKAFNECTVKLFGLYCRLIDTVGLFDTELTSERKAELQFLKIPDLEENHKLVLKNLADIITLCSDGIDAFLLVVDGTGRMTSETKETINVIQRSLGIAMLDHCIFVLTKADRAENDTLEKMKEAISRYLNGINYFDIDDRFVHFDNKRRPRQQVTKLLKVIEENLKKRNGYPYSHVAFQHAPYVLAEEKINDSLRYLRTHRDGRLNIVAIGKVGEGKSATINTMIAYSEDPRPNFFIEEESPFSVTKAFNECTVKLFGLNCRLIDTVGLFDTELTSERKAELQFLKIPDLEEDHKLVLKNLADVITLCSDGIDAFLLVVDGIGRMTYETKVTITLIQRFFGVAMLDHCIFVLTKADRAENSTLEKMKEAISRYLNGINYFDIDDRFIHFDNKRRPRQQVTKLLKVIEENLKKRNGHVAATLHFNMLRTF